MQIISKDLPLLDNVALQYLCCDPSFNLSSYILRSVNLFSLNGNFINVLYIQVQPIPLLY